MLHGRSEVCWEMPDREVGSLRLFSRGEVRSCSPVEQRVQSEIVGRCDSCSTTWASGWL